MPEPRAATGHPHDRVDATSKVTGRARYAADFDAAGLAHAVVVTSTIARGRVTGYDTAGERLPGVSSFIDEAGFPFHPTGGRGPGELGVTGIAAVANAVFHATGKRVRHLPITLDQLV